jgi:hypothetical protein
MRVPIDPEKEYKMMLQFFQNGGTSDNMPEELLRTRRIWKRADELIRKYPWYNNEKIANNLIADMPEYDMALITAKQHVIAAKKYYDTAETSTPATHRRILTDILYRQIAKLEAYQAHNPIGAAKAIAELNKQIALMNHVYEKEEPVKELEGDTIMILSSQDNEFPELPSYSKKELYKIIDKITESIDLNPEERQKLIDKDVEGKL